MQRQDAARNRTAWQRDLSGTNAHRPCRYSCAPVVTVVMVASFTYSRSPTRSTPKRNSTAQWTVRGVQFLYCLAGLHFHPSLINSLSCVLEGMGTMYDRDSIEKQLNGTGVISLPLVVPVKPCFTLCHCCALQASPALRRSIFTRPSSTPFAKTAASLVQLQCSCLSSIFKLAVLSGGVSDAVAGFFSWMGSLFGGSQGSKKDL
jgi:hypothetical protein